MKESVDLLRIRNVHKVFRQGRTPVRVLRGVNFYVRPGEIVALVGESGCGKSTLARTILRLHVPDEGMIEFEGNDVTQVRGRLLRDYRQHVQMIFQDPFASLNPTHCVQTIMRRSSPRIGLHFNWVERDALIRQSLEVVGISPAENFLRKYPHELSGGQRQRVAIARSLVVQPKLVVADEPVSMLDVSLRLGVLNLMMDLNQKFGVAYVYITHDLASARYVASRIAVMYAGDIIEEGTANAIIEEPRHPYTRVLVKAAPDPERTGYSEDIDMVKGEPPNLGEDFRGCPFQFRCMEVHDQCKTEVPSSRDTGTAHYVSCHLY